MSIGVAEGNKGSALKAMAERRHGDKTGTQVPPTQSLELLPASKLRLPAYQDQAHLLIRIKHTLTSALERNLEAT
jgi:hypothetical protein